MRKLQGADLAVGIEAELRDRNRPLMKLFRGVRRNAWGRMLLDKKLEESAADKGFSDIVGPDDGTFQADGSFMERLIELIQWLFSPEGLEGLKKFLDIIIELIKMIMDLFAEGTDIRIAMEAEVAELERLSNEVVAA